MIILQERSGEIHIVDYSSSQGNHMTMCVRRFMKNDIFTTLAADGPIAGICIECSVMFNNAFKDDINKSLRTFMSSSENTLKYYSQLKAGFHSTEIKYWDLSERHSEKIGRYKRKLKRK